MAPFLDPEENINSINLNIDNFTNVSSDNQLLIYIKIQPKLKLIVGQNIFENRQFRDEFLFYQNFRLT